MRLTGPRLSKFSGEDQRHLPTVAPIARARQHELSALVANPSRPPEPIRPVPMAPAVLAKMSPVEGIEHIFF